MAHWNHRVVRRTDKASGETWYGIHECHYDPMQTPDELLDKLARAAKIKMTGKEISAQRKSWVIGELMLSHPNMTREEAEQTWERASSQIYGSF